MAKGGKSYIVHEQRGSLAEARVSLIWPCIIVRNTMGLKANKGSAGLFGIRRVCQQRGLSDLLRLGRQRISSLERHEGKDVSCVDLTSRRPILVKPVNARAESAQLRHGQACC